MQPKNRFSCLKVDTYTAPTDDVKRINRFSREGEVKSPVSSRWKRSKSPPPDRHENNKSPVNVHSRWQRSKSPEKQTDRWENNRSPVNPNSRWQRSRSPENSDSRYGSRSPERGNSFTKRNDSDRPNKGGFGKYRYNHGRGRGGPSEKFDKVKKDNKGRPMVAGAITTGFDINLALFEKKREEKETRCQKIEEMKRKEENEKERRKKKGNVVFEKDNLETSEEQKRLTAEWNKRMIENMQYESGEEEEEEEEDL